MIRCWHGSNTWGVSMIARIQVRTICASEMKTIGYECFLSLPLLRISPRQTQAKTEWRLQNRRLTCPPCVLPLPGICPEPPSWYTSWTSNLRVLSPDRCRARTCAVEYREAQ